VFLHVFADSALLGNGILQMLQKIRYFLDRLLSLKFCPHLLNDLALSAYSLLWEAQIPDGLRHRPSLDLF
jgi:hypothetical protein